MSTLELIYDLDCPNVAETRALLARTLGKLGLPAEWQEWERYAPESPAYSASYGSPTILVDGGDVAGMSPSDDANSCRLYANEDGQLQGVLSAEMLTARLTEDGAMPEADKGRRGLLAVVPFIGFASLPGLTCPACWPAYAGLLSSIGIGFFDYTPYLLPAMAVSLPVAVFSLGFRAKRRRGYLPLAIGVLAAAVVIVGRFIFLSSEAMYAGIALLATVSIWNSWPFKKAGCTSASCCSSE